ncbi:MAG: hypothetical protein K2L82_01055 [Lachnospiraceae bacterium]|nr:hypothetical protein [Lachnospiraceae bacterium]
MKKFIRNICIFLACLSVLLTAYCKLTLAASVKYMGENTEQQIERSFRNAVAGDYNCYFLGNSRMYRGINPDMFTGVKAYNFSHDNDSYNQMYYKLLFLEEEKKEIDYLVIGTDYFQFSVYGDSRNYIYDRIFGLDYMKDYHTSIAEEIFSDIVYFWKTKRNSAQFIMPYLKGEAASEQINHLKDNGQYVMYGTATDEDTVERYAIIRDLQKAYFEKIVDYCAAHDIELYVIMPPTRDEELSSYTKEDMDSFDLMIEETLGERFKGHYLNCSDLPEFKHYSNYTDITHLNEEAAERFSEYLNGALDLKSRQQKYDNM